MHRTEYMKQKSVSLPYLITKEGRGCLCHVRMDIEVDNGIRLASRPRPPLLHRQLHVYYVIRRNQSIWLSDLIAEFQVTKVAHSTPQNVAAKLLLRVVVAPSWCWKQLSMQILFC